MTTGAICYFTGGIGTLVLIAAGCDLGLVFAGMLLGTLFVWWLEERGIL